MMAWMNREAYEETVRTGRACYFSRSRNRLWRKGEESGNVQEVRAIFVDCDADTDPAQGEPDRRRRLPHGHKSCFFTAAWTATKLDRGRHARLRSASRCIRNDDRSSETRHPGRQPAGSHRRSVPQGRLQDHLRQPQLLSGIDDPEIHCTLIRAQEMPRYVQDGSLDCGLTGYDWVLENDAKVIELAELVFSKVSRRPVRWVLAVPNDSPIQAVKICKASASPRRS